MCLHGWDASVLHTGVGGMCVCVYVWVHTRLCVCRLVFGLGLMESVQSSGQASFRKKTKKTLILKESKQ